MKRSEFLDRLNRGILTCDGAMGTQLMAAGLAPGGCGETWNIDRPDAVGDVHRRYRAAGCDCVTTNTFGGSSAALDRHGKSADVARLNAAGAAVARSAAPGAIVLGDIGPFGGFLEPIGDTTESQAAEMFLAQAKALLEGGADAALVETMSDPAELAVAVRAARQAGDWAVIATYAFGRADGVFRTMMGTTVTDAVAAAIDAGADVVGTNCGTSLSLDDYADLAAELVAAAGSVPVIVQPNAGSPQTIDGKLVYAATPRQMADLARKLKSLGVALIGGCCGTTPEHLKAMVQAVGGRP